MTARTLAIWKREVLSNFTSARAYVMCALMMFFAAVIFWFGSLQEGRDASMRGIMGLFVFLLLAITPILTMRTLSEETSRGTLELLLTSPVKEVDIVLGKFLGTLSVYVVLFVLTGIFPVILFQVSTPEGGPMIAQYLGMLLCSMAFISVGIFASSLTSSQVVAAVVSYLVLLMFWISWFFAPAMPSTLAAVVREIALIEHLDNFGKGIVDAVDVFYYLAFTAAFLFLAVRSVEARRWT